MTKKSALHLDHQKMPDVTHTRTAIFAGIFPAALCFFYAPLRVATANIVDFTATDEFLLTVVLGFFVFFAACSLIFLCIDNRFGRILGGCAKAVLSIALAVSVWYSSNDLVSELAFPLIVIVDAAVFAVVFACVWFFDRRAVLMFTGIVGVGYLVSGAVEIIQSDFFGRRDMLLERSGETGAARHRSRPGSDAARHGNVYHILLDAYQSQLWQPIIASHENAAEELKDFRFFENFVTNSWGTQWSLAILKHGKFYDGREDYMDWDRRAHQEGFASRLKEAGVVVSQYVHDPQECIPGSVTCVHMSAHQDSVNVVLVDLWFLSLLPRSLKFVLNEYFSSQPVDYSAWTYGFSLTETVFGLSSSVMPRDMPIVSARRMFEDVLDDEAERTSRGNYVFAHLLPPHRPYAFDQTCNYVPRENDMTKHAAWQSYQCAVTLVVRLVWRLKELGRYNDALILLHADHGATPKRFKRLGLEDFMDLEFDEAGLRFNQLIDSPEDAPSSYVYLRTSGLLAVKFPGGRFSGGTSDQVFQAIDIAPTFLRHFGLPADDMPGLVIDPKTDTSGRDVLVFLTIEQSFVGVVPNFFSVHKLVDGEFQYVGNVDVK